MSLKEFFEFTKEKLILWLVLFYIPMMVIFYDFASRIFSTTHLYVLAGTFVITYVLASGLCMLKGVNTFIKPTSFKWAIFALLTGISLSWGFPFFDTNVLRFSGESLLYLLLGGFLRGLVMAVSVLLQLYIYAGLIELIVRKIKKVDEIPVEPPTLMKQWWFWLIVAILLILLVVALVPLIL